MKDSLETDQGTLTNQEERQIKPTSGSLWLGMISLLPYLIVLIMFLTKGRPWVVTTKSAGGTGSIILVFVMLGLLYLLMVWGVFWGVTAISKGTRDLIRSTGNKRSHTLAISGIILGLFGVVSNIIYYLTVGKTGP